MTIRNQVQKSGNPGKICSILLMLGLVAFCATRARAQKQPAPSRTSPLVLTGIMALPHAEGRLDHMDYDPDGRLFVSALGSDREEVIDLSAERVVETLNVPRPQGVAFVPGLNKIFVGSDEGKLYIFDGASYKLITTIDLGDDADDLRYDAAAKQVYVGYGDGAEGAIGVVDAATDKMVRSYKVGDHPESFQLETSGPEMYVNVPGLKEILAVNRKTGKVDRWPLKTIGGNFPMALDEGDHRLFVVTHQPDSRLAVFNTQTGHLIATLPCVVNSDDLYYDAGFQRVYATGGQGFISVYQQESPDRYRLLAKVPSDIGARTSDYPGRIGMKAFNRFYVAIPEGVRHGAQVWMYSVQK